MLKFILPLLLVFCAYEAHAAPQSITFIQYTDENTALEEVRSGNLDLYYYRVPADRLKDAEARESLKIYESTGGSYSLLVNPAESARFNPFSIKEVRFALNYLLDRTVIVNELMGGYGVPMYSNYGPYDPEYMTVLEALEGFGFGHDPGSARIMIESALMEAGATKQDVWTYGDAPISITIFIRSDDPVRRAIGEILALDLEEMGFEVTREFGDLNKAFVVVYGTDPAEQRWHIYTEGWGGRAAFTKYDSVGLAQMYAPWFSTMPGFNNPGYWNYENPHLDNVTQRIYAGDFASPDERNSLIVSATEEAVSESVRVFIAANIDQYATNGRIDGVVNDFGAGVPSRFTPINARGQDHLAIGVKQIYQGAWNPVAGLGDVYSTRIWGPVNDPAVFRHPFAGTVMPVRATWQVETAGPDRALQVPKDAILWDSNWTAADTHAASRVGFEFEFSNWHNGSPMDIYDILHMVYFVSEWGDQRDNDRTFDPEFSPQAQQSISTFRGFSYSEDMMEVYVDYWHFDENEIAAWASVWSAMPWEVYAAMERAVLDGRASFSRSGATSGETGWLSLLAPNDADMIKEYLIEFRDEGFVPPALERLGAGPDYAASRYNSTISWIDEMNHAVISNGPFLLERYSPESRTITIKRFDDDTYPFAQDRWSAFGEPRYPKIVSVNAPPVARPGETITIDTENADGIRYFVGDISGTLKPGEPLTVPDVAGAHTLKLFAVSDSVMRPDIYSTGFTVSDGAIPPVPRESAASGQDMWLLPSALSIIALAAAILVYVKIKGVRSTGRGHNTATKGGRLNSSSEIKPNVLSNQ